MAAFAGASARAQAPQPPGLPLTGDITFVHDPCIIREGATIHLFSTNHLNDPAGLIAWRTSKDLLHWERNGAVFPAMPDWAKRRVPKARGLWAPDISYANDEFRLYYSVSTFGSNNSAIGLAATKTLDKNAPNYGWEDRGLVTESTPVNNYNAIDPNVITDKRGRQFMAFGSFWSGLKMIELDPETGLALKGKSKLYNIASRPPPGAVEAPFIIRRGEYYYLFASYDFCCRGVDSTYYTIVGRSTSPTGPYVDREGGKLMKGYGSMVLHADFDPSRRFKGPGHCAIFMLGDLYMIVYHAYDSANNGAPTLRIQALQWTEDGWPVAA